MKQPSNRDDVFLVLDDSLPVIHAALTGYYGFNEEEADAFKETLALWFHRVTRRAGGGIRKSAELRDQLIFVACKYAGAFQSARLLAASVSDGLPPQLPRPPEEIAVALLNQIRSSSAPS